MDRMQNRAVNKFSQGPGSTVVYTSDKAVIVTNIDVHGRQCELRPFRAMAPRAARPFPAFCEKIVN